MHYKQTWQGEGGRNKIPGTAKGTRDDPGIVKICVSLETWVAALFIAEIQE